MGKFMNLFTIFLNYRYYLIISFNLILTAREIRPFVAWATVWARSQKEKTNSCNNNSKGRA